MILGSTKPCISFSLVKRSILLIIFDKFMTLIDWYLLNKEVIFFSKKWGLILILAQMTLGVRILGAPRPGEASGSNWASGSNQINQGRDQDRPGMGLGIRTGI